MVTLAPYMTQLPTLLAGTLVKVSQTSNTYRITQFYIAENYPSTLTFYLQGLAVTLLPDTVFTITGLNLPFYLHGAPDPSDSTFIDHTVSPPTQLLWNVSSNLIPLQQRTQPLIVPGQLALIYLQPPWVANLPCYRPGQTVNIGSGPPYDMSYFLYPGRTITGLTPARTIFMFRGGGAGEKIQLADPLSSAVYVTLVNDNPDTGTVAAFVGPNAWSAGLNLVTVRRTANFPVYDVALVFQNTIRPTALFTCITPYQDYYPPGSSSVLPFGSNYSYFHYPGTVSYGGPSPEIYLVYRQAVGSTSKLTITFTCSTFSYTSRPPDISAAVGYYKIPIALVFPEDDEAIKMDISPATPSTTVALFSLTLIQPYA